jgi:hypothetical protein
MPNGNGKKEFRWMIVWVAVLGAFILWRLLDMRRSEEENKPVVTYNRLMFVATGCDKFKQTNGAFPDSLQVLHEFRIELNDPWTKDAWRRNLIVIPYEPSCGYGKIISYGRDGKPGGVGKDRDLEVRFPIRENQDWNKKMANETEVARFLN